MALTSFQQNTAGILQPSPAGLSPLPGPFSTQYVRTDISYDYAIGGIPFLAGESGRGTYFRRIYQRSFAQIRKDQFDNQQVPGEQSIYGWWLRSQSNFQQGAGTQFLDTTEDATLSQRYYYSEGVDTLSTPGQVSLLQATKSIASGLTGPTRLRGVQISGVDSVLVLDTGAKTLKSYNSAGTLTNTYTMAAVGTMSNTFTDDGTNYYYADTTGIWKGVIATPGVAATKLWNAPSTTGANVIAWVKGRLVAGMDNNIYELVGGSPPTLPTVKFAHQNTAYTFTDISEIPTAILTSGSAGGAVSQIHRFTLDSGGALPTLSSGVVTASMPIGEKIQAMYAYIGAFVGIGTNKGFRVASVNVNGDLIYGPLIVQDPTAVGVKAISGYDRFLFIGNQGNKLIPQQGWTQPADISSVDMLVRVDLSQLTSTNAQPYANDLMTTSLDGSITSIANVGTSGTLAGSLAFATGTNVWMTDTANKQTTGFLYTPKIRYNTLEPKHFKYIYMRYQNITDGSMDCFGQNPSMSLTSIAAGQSGSASTASTTPFFISDVGNAQEWMQFKFILHRGTTNTNYSPVWNGYQLRSLPGVSRQILIEVPLICEDHEFDRNGNPNGYDGFAFARVKAVEALNASGNIVLFQDLNYGDANLVIVDDYKFEQQSPELAKTSSSGSADSNSHGGYVILVVRVVA
jgi:hypothetical protein